MSAILVWTEITEGRIKKPVLETLTAARTWSEAVGQPIWAAVIGKEIPEGVPVTLAEYGADKVLRITSPALEPPVNSAYARALAHLIKEKGLSYVMLPQTYEGRAIAPLLAIWADAALLSGLTQAPEKEGNGWRARRIAFSNKAIEWVYTEHPRIVVTLRTNSVVPSKAPKPLVTEELSYTPEAKDLRLRPTGVEKVATDKVPLTEAEVVVSAGRGLKGPENWGMIEELARVLGAATACSKPVADVGWRPHHEHVGQTGIQISPNLYIAIGISGAIQHLAGVASSKNIVVINNDPEAPFFKVADYGIVGDAFEVVPRLTEAIKRYKEQHAH